MPLFPVTLILVSCFLHASWNLLARRQRQELLFFRRKLILAVGLALAVLALGTAFGHVLPGKALLCATGSGLFAGLYFFSLAQAYGASDFTVVYPVARALPLLIVAGIDMLRGRCPSGVGWIALLMVTAGCVLAPQQSYRGFHLRHYAGRAAQWILATAAATVGFTMLDKIAAEMVQRGLLSAAMQCSVFHIFACVSYLSVQHGSGGAGLKEPDRVGWKSPALAAVLGPMTYTLVLWAFQLAPKTAYLVAFRQFSIVIGVAAAFGFYRETGWAVRVPATLSIVAGLVLLAFWG
jgi:hypothetical protein